MNVTALAIPEVLLLEPEVFADDRGHFLELWQGERYARAGIHGAFVQDNLSVSQGGVLRGLHYQWPRTQGKLLSVSHGSVFDVAVDVRAGSPTFARWVGVELSAENHHQLWVPPGFAHGFAVLSDTAVVQYKVTGPYVREDEVTVVWNDPDLAITWPVVDPILAPRDASAPTVSAIPKDRLPVYAP